MFGIETQGGKSGGQNAGLLLKHYRDRKSKREREREAGNGRRYTIRNMSERLSLHVSSRATILQHITQILQVQLLCAVQWVNI